MALFIAEFMGLLKSKEQGEPLTMVEETGNLLLLFLLALFEYVSIFNEFSSLSLRLSNSYAMSVTVFRCSADQTANGWYGSLQY